ncbi:tRNA 2-selenouridine synthase [Planifilum fimeticola]|jgi:tRNA 2-selenouridine synthase|uniref:tRNA 2-selenouridine synthase n=1 Tax=Planifilum fimeticola TaxID=201975 RepID=A0A2T0LJ41_9BACL|nr:tRNA 2-selenouridine(34) synthase MnmH [Planifilum fimeticola]PRX42539.1 tRNA 2-selenouridine synthase [Planifilum fimeticola]
MIREISVEEALNNPRLRWVDVRSPGEFADATVPWAVNVPLFDDEERARVGTSYKQQGRKKAIQLGVRIVSPKIPSLLEQVEEATQGGEPLIFCWRGGMRSKAVATFLDLADRPVYRLAGGYRAYRQYVVSRLESYDLRARLIVLHGLTGVGKTDILQRLSQEGVPVLDLEEMAGHRGSAFGTLGEIRPRNQKMFDSLLFHALERFKDEPYLFMEAESKRIGRVLMPDFLEEAKAAGIPVIVEASFDVRVSRILETYLRGETDPDRLQQQVAGAVSRIERRLPPDVRKELAYRIGERDWRRVVEILLEKYYDPRYLHSQEKVEGDAIHLDAEDLDTAVEACKGIWNRLRRRTATDIPV